LTDYLDECVLADSTMEYHRHQDFDRLIGGFFDRAACHSAEGYEREARLHGRESVTTTMH